MLNITLVESIDSVLDSFLTDHVGRGVILYGAGFACSVIYSILRRHEIPVLGVADSNATLHGTRTSFGTEVLSLDAALARCPDAKILISSPRYFLEIRRHLVRTLGSDRIFPFDLYHAHYFSGSQLRSYITTHFEDYVWLYRRLEDELSRVTLDRIIWAHLTGTVENFLLACSGTEDWYSFRELIHPTGDEVFVDCGAFDGDTILLYDRLTEGRYRAIVACEPNPRIFNEMVRNTGNLSSDRLHLICAGAGSRQGEFELTDEGYFSAIQPDDPSNKTNNGATFQVQLRPLDEITTELGLEPTILKMDIEGAEYDALKGARNIISSGKPRLSICLYHRYDDLFRIPKLIESLNSNYRIYLRHQSYAATDTILVAL